MFPVSFNVFLICYMFLFAYIFVGNSSQCFSYRLQEGCWSTNTCSGIVSVSGTTGGVNGMTGSGFVTGTGPTYAPIGSPSYAPYSVPTYAPNIYDNVFMKVQCSNPNATVAFVPSQQPVFKPSAVPTLYPTFKTPSLAPVVAGSTPAPTTDANLVVFFAAQVCHYTLNYAIVF